MGVDRDRCMDPRPRHQRPPDRACPPPGCAARARGSQRTTGHCDVASWRVRAILAVCGYVYMSQAVSHRTQYSVHNVVGMRVLPDAGLTKWFAEAGCRSMTPCAAAPVTTPGTTARRSSAHPSWPAIALGTRSRRPAPVAVDGRPGARLVGAPPPRPPGHHGRGRPRLRQLRRLLPLSAPPAGTLRDPADERRAVRRAAARRPAGLGIAASDRRRRFLAAVVAAGLVSTIVDVWCSYVGDPMEVNRHMVGPLARLVVLVIVAVALGADTARARLQRVSVPRGAVAPAEPRRRPSRSCTERATMIEEDLDLAELDQDEKPPVGSTAPE